MANVLYTRRNKITVSCNNRGTKLIFHIILGIKEKN